MKPDRLTKKIGLVLIGSSLILSGCSTRQPQPEDAVVLDPTPSFWYFHSSGPVYHGYVSPPIGIGSTHVVTSGYSGSSAGFKSSASVASVRGGFGSMGHAATAGA